MGAKAMAAIKTYLEGARPKLAKGKNSAFLFLNPSGRPMSRQGFWKLVKKYAAKQELDWRLLDSQMYQESRFDPNMKSWAGARGLMQLLPRAAREVGVRSLDTPEQQIKAGVRYLRRMIDLFDPRLPLATRIRFGLASYNAGRGHVLDARRLARQKGWSPDTWYGNVERAMLLLSKPEYFQKARFGFVRGEEPVQYVRDIETRYAAYIQQLP